MPPKAPKKKATAAKKKVTEKPTAKASTAAVQKENESTAEEHATTTGGTKRGRAESVEALPAPKPKKAKDAHPSVVHEIINTDAEEVAPLKDAEPTKIRELDEATKDELNFMEEILSYFIMPAFTATMDAINLPQTPRPDTVPESSKFILEELERRFKAGQSIEKDCAAIKKIEEKFESGEYDEDPDGFERIVRRRINKVEEMVERMTSMYLKNIIKELGSYPMGGTNRDLGGQIVGMLTFKAENKSKLFREYKIVKSCYGFSYGCCGDGNDSLDGEDEDDEEEDGDDW